MFCAGCGNVLKEVFDGSRENHQFDNALDLSLNPGYGEYFDGTNNVRFSLCMTCADTLFTLFPMLRDWIMSHLDN